MAIRPLLAFLAIPAAGAALGAVVAVSCTVDYPSVAFRCNPRQTQNCPDGYFCCSDDPSEYFSGQYNNNSVSGMCVKEGAVSPGAGHPELPKCPIPCNPQATEAEIAETCGSGARCCQTVEITEKDCIQDPDTGMWRPVTGADVFKNLTNWAPGRHDTHQDPNGTVCMALVGSGVVDDLKTCLSTIGVANVRGFCMTVSFCPTEDPTYRNACDCLNNPADPGCL